MFALVAALVGCVPEDTDGLDSAPSFSYPLDDLLRVNELQAVGTHNSYHLRTEGVDRPEWDYDHLPLDQQADAQGVRQFELDPEGQATKLDVQIKPALVMVVSTLAPVNPPVT